MKKLFESIRQHREQAKNCVLVSVVASSGSAPRGAGAHMLMDEAGRCTGTVGGGPVEYQAAQAAKELLAGRGEHQQKFRLYHNSAADIGMVCGGDVTVQFQLLEAGSEPLAAAVQLALDSLDKGVPCWLVLGRADRPSLTVCTAEQQAGEPLPPALLAALPAKPDRVEVEGECWYVQPLLRLGRVYVFGGGHVAQALVPLLASVEFRCTVIEDRAEFCEPALFPGAEKVLLLRPEQWAQQLHIGAEDMVCIMTRGHKSDTDCVAFALGSPANYVGVIGSRKKAAAVNAQLWERGFSKEETDRIISPVGLPIGAKTPAEIAVSIAAQMILKRSE